MAAQTAFYLISALTVAGALLVLTARRLLYAALGLLVAFVGVAAIYVFLNADFLAVTQLMVYVGGVLVLLLFGVMFTGKLAKGERSSRDRLFGAVLATGLLALLVPLVWGANLSETLARQTPREATTVQKLGALLMTDHLIPFEVAGLLLLLALIGATFIAGKKEREG